MSVPKGHAIRRVVTEKREREYRHRVYLIKGRPQGTEGFKSRKKEITDPGGKGYETVKEIKVCADCQYRLWAESQQRDRENAQDHPTG